jgi:hypothetical protein
VRGRWFFRVIVFVWECVVEMAAVSQMTDDAKVFENYGMFQQGSGMTGSNGGTPLATRQSRFFAKKAKPATQHAYRGFDGSDGHRPLVGCVIVTGRFRLFLRISPQRMVA